MSLVGGSHSLLAAHPELQISLRFRLPPRSAFGPLVESDAWLLCEVQPSIQWVSLYSWQAQRAWTAQAFYSLSPMQPPLALDIRNRVRILHLDRTRRE